MARTLRPGHQFRRVNYGGSPGDGYLARPYLYVGPQTRPLPTAGKEFWNAPFGCSLPYEDIASLDHAVGFLIIAGRTIEHP